jgi:hypothetical protein
MILPLIAAALLASSPAPTPGEFPPEWSAVLQAHFEVERPLVPPPGAVDALVEEWLRRDLRPVQLLTDPRWQTDEVLLLDAVALARVHARVDVRSIWPFAGVDTKGNKFALRAAVFGKGRFAFLYDAPVSVSLPLYRVMGRDRFDLGALNLGRAQGQRIYDFRSYAAPDKPVPLKGPWNAVLLSVTRKDGRLQVGVKSGPDVTVDEPQIQAK